MVCVMSENANSTDGLKRAGRPWYRLHVSTCMVLLLLATGLVLVIVPGESGGLFAFGATYRHGWPWEYLDREVLCANPSSEIPPGWVTREGWSFEGDVAIVDVWALLLDLLVALVILVVVGLAFEWRIRRCQRLLQCSLRELLLLTLMIVALLGWWQTENERSREESRIRRELEDLSCSVYTTYRGPEWLVKLVGHRRVGIVGWVGYDPLACAPPEHPGLLHAVTDVAFCDGSAWNSYLRPEKARGTDEDLKRAVSYLNRLKQLKSICIESRSVTDDGLSALAGLTRLHSLEIRDSRCTDAGLACLAGMTRLENLYLSWGEFTDAGMVHVGTLTRLRVLRLAGTKVTGDGLAAISNCRSLEFLDLAYTQVTDAGLEHLGSLANLRELGLTFTGVTDAGLVHLEHLESLEDLDLTGTSVTKEGVDGLRKAIPDCRVHCWE
jgi:hypothetical protein